MNNYKDIVVKKPWGSEYLVYENEKVGLWALSINKNSKTSMHCHPNKDTGLIVIDGEVEVSFLTSKHKMCSGDKTTIRRGLFHSTEALVDGSIILEIESPKEKDDLVRFGDEYGRELSPYETGGIPKTKMDAWVDVHTPISPIGNKFIVLETLTTNQEIIDADDSKIYIIVDGGIVYGNTFIAKHGDVITGKVAKLLLTKFNLCENGMTYVSIQ